MTSTDQSLTPSEDQPSSVVGSPASLIVLQENVRLLVMTVTSGLKSEESFAKLNRDGSWVKMSRGYVQANLENSLVEFCGTWPKWGMVSGGVAGRLPILEPPTIENGSSLWPTPMCPTHHNIGTMQEWGGSANKIRTLPTPSARDHKSGKGSQVREGHAPPLTDIVGGLLNPRWVEWLMGFPLGWSNLNASEMPLSPSKSTQSSGQLQTLKEAVSE